MPEPVDNPTSLPKGPLRTCLERIRAEIVSEMNTAQSPGRDFTPEIEVKQLQHWVNRLTEAIHFNGQVPDCITGLDTEPPGFRDLDDAIRGLAAITNQPGQSAFHAVSALEKLGKHRNKMYMLCCKVIDELERFGHRLLTYDLDAAKLAIKKAHGLIAHDILGVKPPW